MKAKATKAARQAAVVLALEAGLRYGWLPEGGLHLWFYFYQVPGKKLPDDDMFGRCKAYRYAIAQVLGIDDNRFKSHPEVKSERRPGGQVVGACRDTRAAPAAAPSGRRPYGAETGQGVQGVARCGDG